MVKGTQCIHLAGPQRLLELRRSFYNRSGIAPVQQSGRSWSVSQLRTLDAAEHCIKGSVIHGAVRVPFSKVLNQNAEWPHGAVFRERDFAGNHT